jgi:glucose-1-phosphate thymidylyltransferase
MKAIIPMAGLGTRLRPLTYSKPKALLRVGSKPIIAHIIDGLLTVGCGELILIISSDGEKIPLYVKERYPDMKVQSIIQEEQLGLGHAVSIGEKLARNSELIVIYGDTIVGGNLSGIVDKSLDGVISVREVEDPRRLGIVNVKNGVITQFIEKPSKPESNLAIIGFNYFKNSNALFECLNEIIEKDIKTKGEYQITDAFQVMVKRGIKMKPFMVDEWFDAGTQQTLLETNSHMLKKDKNCERLPGSMIIPPVYIPDTASISHSIIGPDVSVGENAIIESSIISNSIIGDEAKIENACLSGSLIGDNARIINYPHKLAISDHSILDFGTEEK